MESGGEESSGLWVLLPTFYKIVPAPPSRATLYFDNVRLVLRTGFLLSAFCSDLRRTIFRLVALQKL